jgi:hypothetical protein
MLSDIFNGQPVMVKVLIYANFTKLLDDALCGDVTKSYQLIKWNQEIHAMNRMYIDQFLAKYTPQGSRLYSGIFLIKTDCGFYCTIGFVEPNIIEFYTPILK